MLIIKDPFYGLFVLGVNRYFSDEVATACVQINGINPELLVNEKFWNSLSDEMQIAVIKHEIGHILYKHLIYWDEYEDKTRFNFAADCEVNSSIVELQIPPYVYPDVYGLPPHQGTKWYYNNLPKNPENPTNPKQQNTQRHVLDDHSGFGKGKNNPDDIPSKEFKKLVSSQIDGIAKNVAEQMKNSGQHGCIPGQFQSYIDSLFLKRPEIFNWKQYFRRMLGTIRDEALKKTRKKESLRFPDNSGIKHKRKANILVAIDTSGSIDNKSLQEFFTELHYIYKAGCYIDVIEFDVDIRKKWNYQGESKVEIKGRGGTFFEPMWNYYKEHINNYNSLIVFTDGFADTNKLVPLKNTIWVIVPDGNKDNFYPGKKIFIPFTKS